MIVYHGSTEIIKNPDVVHSKKYLGIKIQLLFFIWSGISTGTRRTEMVLSTQNWKSYRDTTP